MANEKLSPRQKMINLIYLVLTAILAINVSSEVLDAFKTVNDGISVSNSSLRTKNSDLYAELGKEYSNDSLKAKEAYNKSVRAKQLSATLYLQLEQYKTQIIAQAGGIDTATGKIRRDDDLDASTRLLVENEGRLGKQLKQQIADTRKQLLELVAPDERVMLEKSLALKIDEPQDGKSWELARFGQVPAVAAVTLLTKYQNDLLNAESHVVETLYSSINKDQHKVDRMEARILSPSNYILQGETYKADVLVAAYSSTQHPDVFIGQFNSSIQKDEKGNYQRITDALETPPLISPIKVDVEGGFGHLQLQGSTIGNKKYTGVVRVKNPAGKYEFYPFEGEYQVAPKVAVVSPVKLNVLYIGLENPMNISVPGVAQSDVTAEVDANGRLVKNEDGSYKALMTQAGNCKVKVSARINGKQMLMGEQQFRVKRIPNPRTTLDGVSEGGGATASFVAQRKGVVPTSGEFIYGELPWQVLSYVAVVHIRPDVYKFATDGPALNPKAKDLIKGLKKGDAVFFDDIMVKGPDGNSRKISPIAYNITGR